jgi:predicted nucleic acid-binding protein
MVLVDTSIWINHFNKSSAGLISLLNSAKVCIHPFIIGELACGNISNRTEILQLLKALPAVDQALDEEVFALVENKKLYGIGLGFIDVHLLASALINNVKIWTADKALNNAAVNLDINQSNL